MFQKTGSGDYEALGWHLTWDQLPLWGDTEAQQEQMSREPCCNIWAAISHQSLPEVWPSRH